MKYCSHCGAEIHENAVVCVKCGCAVVPNTYNNPTSTYNTSDIPSGGLNVLAFFIPLVGLILYITMNQNTPRKAKAIGKWALIGFIVSIFLYVIALVLQFV